MTPVVLDTDVASLSFKRRLPPTLLAHLARREPEHLTMWLNGVGILHSTDKISRVWGEIAAFAERRGRPRPTNETWIAACCLAEELPLATLNVKDFSDFAEHEGLSIITA